MNDSYIQSVITKYKSKGILVDTNILLLFFVGSSNPARISRFPRTEQFDESDFELLLSAFQSFSKIISTPHILDEWQSV